jgi:prefoldin subunit 5
MSLLQLPRIIEAVNELGQELEVLKAKVELLEKQIELAKTVKENITNANKAKKQ